MVKTPALVASHKENTKNREEVEPLPEMRKQDDGEKGVAPGPKDDGKPYPTTPALSGRYLMLL